MVVKVRLSDLSRVGVLTFSRGDQAIATGVIDPGAGFAYYGTDTDPGRIIKIRLADFTKVGTLVLPQGEKDLISAAIDPAGGFAYFGTDTNPGRVIKIRLSDFTRVGALTLNTGEAFLGSAAIDPADGYAAITRSGWSRSSSQPSPASGPPCSGMTRILPARRSSIWRLGLLTSAKPSLPIRASSVKSSSRTSPEAAI